MALRQIRLELARCTEFPDGSPAHGYEFTAPLDVHGDFDPVEWKKSARKCVVRRFWGAEPEEKGMLIRAKGRTWAFSYVPDQTEDDEPIFRFDRHTFRTGEYVSITEHDGVQRTFRVTSVR